MKISSGTDFDRASFLQAFFIEFLSQIVIRDQSCGVFRTTSAHSLQTSINVDNNKQSSSFSNTPATKIEPNNSRGSLSTGDCSRTACSSLDSNFLFSDINDAIWESRELRASRK